MAALLFSIVIIFVICQSPRLVLNIYEAYQVRKQVYRYLWSWQINSSQPQTSLGIYGKYIEIRGKISGFYQHGANLIHHQTKGNFKMYSGYLVYLPRQVTVCAVCRHTHTRSRDTQARLVAVG